MSENAAGVLIRSHLGAAGDCAIARIEGRAFDPKVHDLKVTVKHVGRPHLGDVVVKSGRTTGVTIGKVRRTDVMAKINYGGTVGLQKIGGFEIGPLDPDDTEYEVSMGGDSGSAWLAADLDGEKAKATDVMVGLHFAGETDGEPDEHALACYAHAVFEKLEITLDSEQPVMEARGGAPGGSGYDQDFLGRRVESPALVGKKHEDEDFVKYRGGRHIPYTHFSVCLSKSRKLAHYVAWNRTTRRRDEHRRPRSN